MGLMNILKHLLLNSLILVCSFLYLIQAVLAHELGHLKCDHGVWLTFANILTLGAYSVPGKLLLFSFQLVHI